MILTDKCLAIATATLLTYGMLLAGTLQPSSAHEGHAALIHPQVQGDTTIGDHTGVSS